VLGTGPFSSQGTCGYQQPVQMPAMGREVRAPYRQGECCAPPPPVLLVLGAQRSCGVFSLGGCLSRGPLGRQQAVLKPSSAKQLYLHPGFFLMKQARAHNLTVCRQVEEGAGHLRTSLGSRREGEAIWGVCRSSPCPCPVLGRRVNLT
jgi:hypothetical protein